MSALACCLGYAVVAFVTGMGLVVGEYRDAARKNRQPEFVATCAALGVIWPVILIMAAVDVLNGAAKRIANVDALPEVQERKRQALERELGIDQNDQVHLDQGARRMIWPGFPWRAR